MRCTKTSFSKWFFRCTAAAALITTAAAVTFSYLDDPRVFETEGNAVTDLGQGGDDWANAAGTASGLTKAVATSLPSNATETVNGWPFLVADPQGYTIFGGGSKDTLDISSNTYTSGSVPPKDELGHGFAAAYQVQTGAPGAQPHTWIYFGADRISTNGDSNIGIWFLQNSITANSDANSKTKFGGVPCPAGATNCSVGDLHRDNDVFIVSAFTQGGAIGTITVYHWDHTVSGGLVLDDTQNASQCTPGAPSHSLVCAVINTTNQVAPWPFASTDSGVAPQVFNPGSFFEGGFDLTGLFNQLGKAQPCFSSFMEETRSSQSLTATIKDFVLGSFQLCSISANATCVGTPAIVQTPTPHIHYTFGGNVVNDGAGALFSLQVATSIVPAGATNVVITQPVAPAGGLVSGTGAPFSGSFDYPNQGVIALTGSACGSAFAGGSCTVTNDKNGNPAVWNASFGSGTCQVTTNPALTLTKSCVVNLVAGPGGVVLQLADTITVCNTSQDGTQIKNISLSNAVSNAVPSPDAIVTGLTLNAGVCQPYTPTYTPTGCINSVINGANPNPGRCVFQDTVSVSSVPTDEFGTPLPANKIPGAQTAQCAVCPAGVCAP